jgi:hypothetical protein
MSLESCNRTATPDGRSVLINALYLRCGHCDGWAPSRNVFWYFEGYERARSRGATSLCSRCSRPTPAQQQSYRAFLSDGRVLEG